MDAQDFRSLQEAYSQVYQLDELDKRTLQSYQSKAKNQVLGSMSKVSDTTVKRVKGLQQAQKRLRDKKYGQQKEETDIYDIILSHLLDEGYAETPEAAEAIMVNMSEDWREEIVEARIDEELTGARKQKASDLLNRKLRDVETLRRLSARKRQKPEDVGSGNKARRRAGQEVKDSTLGISDN
jgi:hypothetical protein